MHLKEYIHLDVHQLAHLIKTGDVSAKEALHCALERMQAVNPKLNAIVTDCSDFALQCLAKMRGDEPYYGVPLLVKDLGHAIEGIRGTEGSKFFAHNIGKKSSDLVTKLIALGFLPFAKTNIPELGLSYVTESVLWGACRNPYDLNRTSGGSSGGSAAAVAAGIAPIATASDGGGSIRIPAACCGLFGFKPTTGLTPTGPWVGELWSGMATNFVLTRSASDASELFSKLINPFPQCLSLDKKKSLTIACVEGAFAGVPVDPVCLEAVDKAKELLKKAGHHLVKKTLNLDLDGIGQCTLFLIAANTCAVVKLQEKESDRKVLLDELEPITQEFYRQGSTLSACELIAAKNKLYQLLLPLHEFLNQVDLILTPALAQLPLPIGQLSTGDEFNSYLQKNTQFSPFTSLFNQAGLPAMTLPVMKSQGLPVSIQLGAAAGKDLLLLSLAQQLQLTLPKDTPSLL